MKKNSKEWLEVNGYDGLFNSEGECACEKDGLEPCGMSGEETEDCQPGYKHLDPRPGKKEFGDFAIWAKKESPTLEEWESTILC